VDGGLQAVLLTMAGPAPHAHADTPAHTRAMHAARAPTLHTYTHTETARAPEGLESFKLAEKPHTHPAAEDEEKLKVGWRIVCVLREAAPSSVYARGLQHTAARSRGLQALSWATPGGPHGTHLGGQLLARGAPWPPGALASSLSWFPAVVSY
jgi:hypothetical protein